MQKLFQNAQIAQPDGTLLAVDILVTDGIIQKFSPARGELAPAAVVATDLHGLFVMPGGVDGHVHFDDPGFTEGEDFGTGTMGAAAGGVTTIVDMPCTSLPAVTTSGNFKTKMKAVESKAYVDYAFWGGTTPTFIDSGAFRRLLPELKELGVVGIKAYTISGMQTYPRLDTRQMVMLFEAARDFNMLVAVHAEDYFLATYYTEKIIREGRTDPLAYKDGRTYDAEPLAVSTVLALARREHTRVHIVHMSTSAGVDLVRQAKGQGINVYRFGEIMSTNPAKRLGLFPRKGILTVGSDADFACVDLDAQMTVHANDLYAKNKYTPFEGRELRGVVRQTFVRGNQVYDGSGWFPAGAGYGQFIKAV